MSGYHDHDSSLEEARERFFHWPELVTEMALSRVGLRPIDPAGSRDWNQKMIEAGEEFIESWNR